MSSKNYHHTFKAGPASATRRVYACPSLQDLGDLRGLTLGGSPGLMDPGNVDSSKAPGAPETDFSQPDSTFNP